MSGGPYPNLYARLIANTGEPEWGGGCWPWLSYCDRWGYGRLNVYVPGLARKRTLMAHLLLYVCVHASPQSVDEAYLAYLELTYSGLELDHLCVVPNCINVDHHEAVTHQVNVTRANERRRARRWA
jgi:hypothetical protein